MIFSRSTAVITVGLSPCWDIICYGQNLNWQEHPQLDNQQYLPAGKALNVSKALAWMGRKSIAAGLWGSSDYQEMLQKTSNLKRFVTFQLTPVPGNTRRNITIIDTDRQEEMHLRAPNSLITAKSLKKLSRQLVRIVKPGDFCVFSGSLPSDENLPAVIDLIKRCIDKGARVVVDTSGVALKAITKIEGLWLIKPNLREFTELFPHTNNSTVRKYPAELALAKLPPGTRTIITQAVTLLDCVENVLISLGEAGAMLVNRYGVWQGSTPAATSKSTLTTVGCGDYMLAGFINSYIDTLSRSDSKARSKSKGNPDTKARANTRVTNKIHSDDNSKNQTKTKSDVINHPWYDNLANSLQSGAAHAWSVTRDTAWKRAKNNIETVISEICTYRM